MRSSVFPFLLLASVALVSADLQHPTPRLAQTGGLSLHRRQLRQLGGEDNTAFLAEEEEREQELEDEAEWQQTGSKLTNSASTASQASNYQDEEEAEFKAELDQEEKQLKEEQEFEQEELYNDEYNPRNSEQTERQKEGALEEEEELEEGEGSLLDYTEDLTQGKQEEEEAGKASESAVQESQAKLNPTKNSTKTIEAGILGGDDALERALDVHLQGEGQKSAVNGSAATSTRTEALSGAELEALEESSEGLTAEQESLGKGSKDTLKENSMKTSNVSIAALANNDDAPRNVSIMAQGAILGSTIGGMVKDNSSSIAGVVGLIVAGAAGVAVAFAGISLYQRFKNRRSSSKTLPRIIEIGALANRSKPKSPSYARVNDKNQDNFGSSGAQWPDNESAWEGGGSNQEVGPNGTAVKHKKAWDWDADW